MRCFIPLLLLAFSARADPWGVSGQTQLNANTAIDNPYPADSGAVGGVVSLPYVVPYGKQLCINGYVMEGYDAPGIAVLFVWTGAIPAGENAPAYRMDHGLPSVAAHSGSRQISLRYCFPEGGTINIRLINGSTYSGVYGWGVWGELNPAIPQLP